MMSWIRRPGSANGKGKALQRMNLSHLQRLKAKTSTISLLSCASRQIRQQALPQDAPKPTLSTVRGGLRTPAGQRKVVHLGTVVDDDLDVPTWQRKRQSASAPEAKPAAEGKDKYDIPAFLRKQAN